MNKYNFALIPLYEQTAQFINYTTALSYSIHEIDKYKLSNNTQPHVTLCHFDTNENEMDHLWEQVQTVMQQKSIKLTFNTLRNKSYPGKPYDGINWYSLIPKETKELRDMHNTALTIIKDPKSISGQNYDPHLTLLTSRDMRDGDSSSALAAPLTAEFVLAITDRDAMGQATRILRCNHIKP